MAYKVSKININPTRSIDLGPSRGWVSLSAGIEIVFDSPTDNPEEVKSAYKEAREFVKHEMAQQYAPHLPKKKEEKKDE